MSRTKDFDEKEVLQKAVCVFWNKGYNATSLTDLTDGLGISRSSLYDTFGNKRQLYLKALDAYQQQYGGQLCTLIRESVSAKAAIEGLLNLVAADLLSDKQRKGCFMVNAGIELAAHDAEVNNLICQSEQQLEQAFLKVIQQGQERSEISKDKDSQAIARFFGNTVKGMQVSAKSITDPRFFDDIICTALIVLE